MLWYSPGSLTRRKIWDMAGHKGFYMSLKACAYRKKGDDAFASRNRTLFQFVRGECGTSTRAYLAQASDQRETCLVDKPAKGWPVSVAAP